MYNTARPRLSVVACGLCLTNEAPSNLLPLPLDPPLPSSSCPQGKPDPRGVSLHFFNPTWYKQAAGGAWVR